MWRELRRQSRQREVQRNEKKKREQRGGDTNTIQTASRGSDSSRALLNRRQKNPGQLTLSFFLSLAHCLRLPPQHTSLAKNTMRPARARQPATRTATAAVDNTTANTMTPSARSTRLSRRNQANENNERRVADSEDDQNKSCISSTTNLDYEEPKTVKNKKDIGFTIIIPYKPFPRKLTKSNAAHQKTSTDSEDGHGNNTVEASTVETKSTRTRRGARRAQEELHIPVTNGEVDDIEYPRQQVQRMEAVVLFEKPTLRKPAPTSNTLLEQKLENMTEGSEPETISAIAKDITAAATEGFDVGSFSKLSISPPPSLPMFDLKDPDGSGSPWLMVFDSSEHSSNSRPSWLRESWDDEDTLHVPDSPSLPTRSHHTRQKDEHTGGQSKSLAPVSFPKIETRGWMDEDDDIAELEDKGEDGDDPFGFSRVERRIKRAQMLQPVSRSHTPMDSDNRFYAGIDNANSFDSPKPRRRGETRNKGKDVDRTWFLSKGHLHTTTDTTTVAPEGESEELRRTLELSKVETKNSTAMSEVEDQDLKKALQLSMGLDFDAGVGSSSMASLFSHLETTAAHNDASSSDIPRTRTKAATRSVRSPSPDSGPEDLFAVTEAHTTRATSPVPPSTPPRKSRSNHHRISFGDMDESPILIERTPTKKPEAGMPASMESPSSSSKGNRRGQTGRAKRAYMRTEQLEAILPRRKKARVAASTSKSTSLRLDTSDDEEEEEEEEEDEPLVRRGRNRQHATAASTTSVTPPKETPAKVAPSKNTSKSATLKQTSDRKGKGKNKDGDKTKQQNSDDKSGWTEAQLKAHEERIRYFEEIDNFELDVETTR